MGEISSFVEGAVQATEVLVELESEGYEHLAHELFDGLVKMVNGYYEKLIRTENRIESEEAVLDHVKQHMRRIVYPGDLAAEQGGRNVSG